MAERPSKVPRWSPADGVTIEPNESRKTAGWVPSMRPPAGWLNWFWRGVSQWLYVLDDARFSNWRTDVHDSGAGITASRSEIMYSRILSKFVAASNDDAPRIRLAGHDLKWSTPGTPPSAGIYTLAESASHVVAFASNGHAWRTNGTGGTWTDEGQAAEIGRFDATRNKFVAVPRTAGDAYSAAANADTWAAGGTTTVNARALACNGTRWALFGLGGGIETSDDDGDNWTTRTSGTSNDFFAAIWVEALQLFIAVGEAGTIKTSPTGQTWTTRTSGVTVDLKLLCLAGETILASDGADTLISSRDGINWVKRVVPAGEDLGPALTDSPIGVIGHASSGLLH